MKKLMLLFSLVLLISFDGVSQDNKPLSPKETVSGKIGSASVEIVYSRPSARGRKMLGEKEPFGKVWRTGANKATIITFDKDVTIEGKKLAAGKYELFTIPGENEWVIIFQNFANQSGAFSYDEKNDVLRVTVKPSKTPEFVETFTIAIEKAQVKLSWENTQVAFGVKS